MNQPKCECGHVFKAHDIDEREGAGCTAFTGEKDFPESDVCPCTAYRPAPDSTEGQEPEPCPIHCRHSVAEHEAFDAGLRNEVYVTGDPHLGEIYRIGNSVWKLNHPAVAVGQGGVDALLDNPEVYLSMVTESHCKGCDALADLRFGYCFGCAEAESIIVDGTDMRGSGLDGKPAVTALERVELLVKCGWLSPRLAKAQLTAARSALEELVEAGDVSLQMCPCEKRVLRELLAETA